MVSYQIWLFSAAAILTLLAMEPLLPWYISEKSKQIQVWWQRLAMQAQMEVEILQITLDQDRYLETVKAMYPDQPSG